MQELPKASDVRKKIRGANPADAKARQDAALNLLVEYIHFRSGYLSTDDGPLAPLASSRSGEYYQAAKFVNTYKQANGEEVATIAALSPEAMKYAEGGPVVRLEVLKQLLSQDSVAAYEASPGFQDLIRPEGRFAVLKRKGDAVGVELKMLGDRAKAMEGPAATRLRTKTVDTQKTLAEMQCIAAVVDRRDWSASEEGQAYLRMITEAERRRWLAQLSSSVAAAERLHTVIYTRFDAGGQASAPAGANPFCAGGCETTRNMNQISCPPDPIWTGTQDSNSHGESHSNCMDRINSEFQTCLRICQ